MKYLALLLLTALTGCANQALLTVYGEMPSNIFTIAQICIKDKTADITNTIRYSVLFKSSNRIKKFDNNDLKYNGHHFYVVPLGQRSDLVGFLLPLEYKELQYFGFMWEINKSINSNGWTSWRDPDYSVKDISDFNFKVDNGLIGKEKKDQTTVSPYLVRFKEMYFEDYIRGSINKWEKEVVENCEIQQNKKLNL